MGEVFKADMLNRLRAIILVASVLSLAVAFAVRFPESNGKALEIGRYSSQSKQITEYLFEGTETKAYWV